MIEIKITTKTFFVVVVCDKYGCESLINTFWLSGLFLFCQILSFGRTAKPENLIHKKNFRFVRLRSYWDCCCCCETLICVSVWLDLLFLIAYFVFPVVTAVQFYCAFVFSFRSLVYFGSGNAYIVWLSRSIYILFLIVNLGH